MVEIPQCNGELATLKISIEPNVPEPGSYTFHFVQPDAAGIGFNAAPLIDLPYLLNHLNGWVNQQKGFTRICQEGDDLYIQSTAAIDTQVHLTPTSFAVNLYQIFSDAESRPMRTNPATIIPMHSMVPELLLESRGIILHKEGKYEEAQAVFDNAARQGKITTAAGMYYVGLNTLKLLKFVFFDMGEHELTSSDEPIDLPTFRRMVMLWSAATTFSRAEKLSVGDDDPYIDLAQRGKFKALTGLDKLGQIDDPNLKEHLHALNLKLQALETAAEDDGPAMHPGIIRELIADVEMHLEKDPDNPDILINLALHFSNAGRYPEAIDLAEKALSLSTNVDKYKTYLKVLVEIHRRAGDEYVKGRIQALERFVAVVGSKRPTHSEWKELAELYTAVGWVAKAVDAAENAVIQAQRKVEKAERMLESPDPKPTRTSAFFSLKNANAELACALNFLGNTFIARHDRNPQAQKAKSYLQKAFETYVHAIKSDPKNFDSLLGLARSQYKLGNYKEAIKIIQVAVELRDDDPKALTLLDEMYFSKRGDPKAEKELERFSAHLSAQALVMLGKSRLQMPGRTLSQPMTEGLQVFRTAVELDPKNIEAWSRLGLNLYDVSAQHPEHKQEALTALTRALNLLSEDADFELEAAGILSDNANVELVVALVTIATELNQPEIATKYLEDAEKLDRISAKRELRLETIERGRIVHRREFEAIDNLLHLQQLDEHGDRRLKTLKWFLYAGLEVEAKTEKPEGSNSNGTPGIHTGAATIEVSPSISGASGRSAAPEGNIPISVGGFANGGQVLFSEPPWTSSTEAASVFNYATSITDPGAEDMEIMPDSVDSAFYLSVQPWMETMSITSPALGR